MQVIYLMQEMQVIYRMQEMHVIHHLVSHTPRIFGSLIAQSTIDGRICIFGSFIAQSTIDDMISTLCRRYMKFTIYLHTSGVSGSFIAQSIINDRLSIICNWNSFQRN